MEQREVDNMLLSMIQKHFPSLPLSDEHTDWGKWLGFARAVYESGRASPASVPEVTDGMAIAFHNALTDGSIGQSEVDEIKTGLRAAIAAAPTPPVSEDRKGAERYQWLVANSFDKSGVTQFHIWKHSWEPHSKTGEQIEWSQRIRGPALDTFIDAAMQEDKKP